MRRPQHEEEQEQISDIQWRPRQLMILLTPSCRQTHTHCKTQHLKPAVRSWERYPFGTTVTQIQTNTRQNTVCVCLCVCIYTFRAATETNCMYARPHFMFPTRAFSPIPFNVNECSSSVFPEDSSPSLSCFFFIRVTWMSSSFGEQCFGHRLLIWVWIVKPVEKHWTCFITIDQQRVTPLDAKKVRLHGIFWGQKPNSHFVYYQSWSQITTVTKDCRVAFLNAQHVKPWSRWAPAAEDHIGSTSVSKNRKCSEFA